MGESPYRLQEALGDTSDRVALIHGEHHLSYADLDARADRVAEALGASGLGPGARLAVLARTRIEIPELLIGAARAGVVTVPVNWRLSAGECAAILAHCRAELVIADAESLAVLPSVAGRVVELGPDYESWLSEAPRTTDGPSPTRRTDSTPDDVVLQVYTSGTSGSPKGVLLTDANLAAKVAQIGPWWGLNRDSRSLLATPLFHVGGLSWILVSLYAGATTYLAHDTSPVGLQRVILDRQITHTFLVPTMIHSLVELSWDPSETSWLQAIVHGAAPMPAAVQDAAFERFGPVLHHVYGLSETTGAVAELPASAVVDDARRHRSVGRAYPWVQLGIRDPQTEREVGAGGFGEVWVRSGQNTPGYAESPELTEQLITADGWLRTGDGGYVDEDGYLYLTDRIKDLIITGGENVHPGEVEEALESHPDVREAVAFGLPDDHWGERVAAAVTLRAGARVEPDDLRAFVGQTLARYKQPSDVWIVESLPRNATGKVLRRDLKEQFT